MRLSKRVGARLLLGLVIAGSTLIITCATRSSIPNETVQLSQIRNVEARFDRILDVAIRTQLAGGRSAIVADEFATSNETGEALVLCGAAKIRLLSPQSAAGAVLATYRAYTGSDNGYGFFAPGVASEWRGHFDVCREDGRCTEADLPRGNAEANVLLSTIHGMLAYEVRDVLAASLAAAELARVPDAKTVVVRVQVYAVPTMAQFRAGRRARWRTAYAYAFTRADARS